MYQRRIIIFCFNIIAHFLYFSDNGCIQSIKKRQNFDRKINTKKSTFAKKKTKNVDIIFLFQGKNLVLFQGTIKFSLLQKCLRIADLQQTHIPPQRIFQLLQTSFHLLSCNYKALSSIDGIRLNMNENELTNRILSRQITCLSRRLFKNY